MLCSAGRSVQHETPPIETLSNAGLLNRFHPSKGGKPIRKLISLGQACEVGFQLRQHSGDNTAHFFDWLNTTRPLWG
jgi:hypothetical protein